MKKIKILQILSALELTNGVTSYVMNHYSNLDHTKFSVHFLIVKTADKTYEDLINSYGDKIIYGPKLSIKNLRLFKEHARKIFSENDYDIIHCHEFNWAMPYMKEAKKKNISNRIFHAHLTLSSPKLLNRLRNSLLIPMTIKSSNIYWACSEVAGKYFFGEKDFYLSYNAINSSKYFYNEDYRLEIRNELNINNNEKVIGFIGRFEEQKNPLFIIDVIKKVNDKRKDIKFVLAGKGHLYNKMQEKITDLKLNEYIIFVSPRTDIYKFYSAFDLLLLPSLFEGLPVVGVEALFSNLNQLYSTTITKEINIINNITYLDLKQPIEKWADKAIEVINSTNNRSDLTNLTKLQSYDISFQAKVIENKYISIAGENNGS